MVTHTQLLRNIQQTASMPNTITSAGYPHTLYTVFCIKSEIKPIASTLITIVGYPVKSEIKPIHH